MSWSDDVKAPAGVYHAPLEVIFSNHDVVEPDLLYLSNERATEHDTSFAGPRHAAGRRFQGVMHGHEWPFRWFSRQRSLPHG